MKLSSYSNNSNNYASCLNSYDYRDIVMSDYSTFEPLMLSNFKRKKRKYYHFLNCLLKNVQYLTIVECWERIRDEEKVH